MGGFISRIQSSVLAGMDGRTARRNCQWRSCIAVRGSAAARLSQYCSMIDAECIAATDKAVQAN
jgi:hypothetical protein